MSAIGAKTTADCIWSNWQSGSVLTALPDGARPQSRRDGYTAQSLLAMKASRGLIGWKIAATSAAGQAHIKVDGPIAGRLFGERTFTAGATLSLAHNRMRVAEPEFAFRAGRDLGPKGSAYTTEQVLAAMDALIPALEVPDSRFADFTSAGTAQLIADNACAHEFVLGTSANADWLSLDLARYPVHATQTKANGSKIERDGVGSNVLGDPRLALTWFVNEITGLGMTLTAGQIVTTGTCMLPLAIEPGDHVHADFGVLGQIEARFE